MAGGPPGSELAPRVAVVDSGALYAAADQDDANHRACLSVLEDPSIRLVIPALAVAEVTYLIDRRLGARAEARFLASLAEYDVRGPEPVDWKPIARLVEKYRELPLGGTDASVVVLANRLRTRLIVTTDRRHFGVLRDAAGRTFELLPAL